MKLARQRSIVLTLGAALGIASLGCVIPAQDPKPFPDVGPPPAFYPDPQPRSATTAINLEISELYLTRMLTESMQAAASGVMKPCPGAPTATPPDPGYRSGLHVIGNASLTEAATGNGAVLNLMTAKVVPWIGAHGTSDEVELYKPFRLSLRLIPYLITMEKVPDEGTRRSILCMAPEDPGPTEAVLLRLEPHEIFDIDKNTEYACGNPGIRDDMVADGVVRGICEALRRQQPIKIPSNDIIDAVRNLSAAGTSTEPLKLTNIALGAQQGLKIGLEFNAGSHREFTSAMRLNTTPAAHWGVDIDPYFIEAAVLGAANSRFVTGSPWVSGLLGPVAFTHDGFTATVVATRSGNGLPPPCLQLDFRVWIATEVHIYAKRNFDGQVILESFVSTVETREPLINHVIKACHPWFILVNQEVLPEPKPVPQEGVCRFRLGSAMEFQNGNDTLYATGVGNGGNGGNGLFIVGNSANLAPGNKEKIDQCMV